MEIDIFITELKENYPLIKHFGPIYIDFDEYPRYSGITSATFEKKVFNVIMVMIILRGGVLCTWVNEEIWVMMKTCFPDAKHIN